MKNIKPNEKLLTEQSAAEYLGISYAKLRLSIRPKNEIAFHRLGSQIRYTLDDLKAYVSKNRVEARK